MEWQARCIITVVLGLLAVSAHNDYGWRTLSNVALRRVEMGAYKALSWLRSLVEWEVVSLLVCLATSLLLRPWDEDSSLEGAAFSLLAVDAVWLLLMGTNLCTQRYFFALFKGLPHHPCDALPPAALPAARGARVLWARRFFRRACRGAALFPLFGMGLLHAVFLNAANIAEVIADAGTPLEQEDAALLSFS